MSLLGIIVIMFFIISGSICLLFGCFKKNSSVKFMMFGIELTIVGIFISFLGLLSFELIIPYSIVIIGIIFCFIGFIKDDNSNK